MKKVITLAFITFTSCLLAQPDLETSSSDHKLQIGLAAVTSQSIYQGGNNQTRVFPAIDYQYKRFYFQAGDLGFKVIDEGNWEVDFGLGVDLIGDVDRGDSPLLENLPDISLPLNAFTSAQYKSSIGLFKIKHNHEINNKHNGNTSSLSYSAPIFAGKWLLLPQLSYEHYSAEVINYFFGVTPTDASVDFPAYRASSGTAFSLSILSLYQINNKWSFVGNLKNDFLGDEITDSPIVDSDQRFSVFAGFLYKFF